MIMWDRIRKNIEDGIGKIVRGSQYVSERARIEVKVGRLLMDKGALEIKRDKACKAVGERVYALWEQKTDNIQTDLEVVESLREMYALQEQIDIVNQNIKKASMGGGEEE